MWTRALTMPIMRIRSLATGAVAALLAALAGCSATPGGAAASAPVPAPASAPPPAVLSTAAAGAALDGTAFYYTRSADAAQVVSVRGNTVTRHLRIPVAPQDYCLDNSIIVSPDGQWLAWVNGDLSDGDIWGKLSVSR